jgi:hypothetical protein
MARRRKASGAGPGHDPETDKGDPGAARGPEQPRNHPTTERSEDFAERRDVETADEPAEEHDRRHHAGERGQRRGRSDVESGQPV